MVKMVKLLGKYSIFALLCWTLLISLKDDFFANEVMKNPVKQFYNDSSEKEYTYKGFTYVINNDDTISIKKYTGKSKKVSIPSKINGKTVTQVIDMCFSYNDFVQEITIPNTICYYGPLASWCDNLEKVTINTYKPDIEALGGVVFFTYANGFLSNCPKLETIIVNENDVYKSFYVKDNILYSYGDKVDSIVCYPGGKKDKTYTFNKDVELNQSAFSGNNYIEKIIFKKKIIESNIPSNCVFRWCKNLKEVQCTGTGITVLDAWFDGCSSLEKFVIPDTVTEISGMLFNGCKSLKEMVVPKNVKKMGISTFQDCNSLEKCIIYNDDIEFEECTDESIFNTYSDNFVLYCNKGSNTEKYAKKFGMKYKYIKDLKVDAEEPEITKNIKGGTYSYKDTVTLKVSAKVSDKGKLSYQWYKNTKKSQVGATKIKGATSSSYKVPTNSIGKNYYFCKVTNKNKKVNGKTSATTVSKIVEIKVQKAVNPITKTSKYSKEIGSTLQLKPKGSATYTSSNSKVASVNSKGKVTFKNYGTAIITVKADGNKYYKSATKKITIVVTPKQAKVVSIKSPTKDKMVVKWKRDSKITGYEIQYATDAKFKNAEIIDIKKNKTTSATIKNLDENAKYYVRVREYKKIGKNYVYGNWSKLMTSE